MNFFKAANYDLILRLAGCYLFIESGRILFKEVALLEAMNQELESQCEIINSRLEQDYQITSKAAKNK